MPRRRLWPRTCAFGMDEPRQLAPLGLEPPRCAKIPGVRVGGRRRFSDRLLYVLGEQDVHDEADQRLAALRGERT